jgi:hypothetical protein
MGIRVTKMISSPKSVFPKEEMVVDHILLLFKCEENYEVNEFRVKDNEVATATDIINEITKKIPVPA